MHKTVEYSESELNLIKSISDHWIKVIKDEYIDPPSLYKILAIECFAEDRRGPEIDALRRVIQALRSCKPYRLTIEFDNLCKF